MKNPMRARRALSLDIALAGAFYVIVMCALTVWAYRRCQAAAKGGKSEDYFLAGRRLGWFTLVFTIVASQASAGTVVGSAALGTEWGYAWVLAVLFQLPSAFLFLGILGKKFAIVGRKLGALTIVDFLRHRYENPIVVVVAALSILVFMTVYIMAQLVGGARVLASVTGLPYTTLLLVFTAIVIAYTATGGAYAGALSDAFQGVIMFGGGIAIWAGIIIASDFSGLGQLGLEKTPELLLFPGPGNLAGVMLFSLWIVFGAAAIGHPHVAVKCMTYRDSRAMHRAMVAGPIIMGVTTFGFVAIGPLGGLLTSEGGSAGDKLVPIIALQVLPNSIAGVILMAALASMMSTVDGMLLIVASTIVRDLYQNYVNPAVTDRVRSRLSMTAATCVGIAAVGFALRPPEFFQVLVILAAGGLVTTFLFPVVLGLYWRRANALGAGLGIVGGLTTFAVVELAPSEVVHAESVLPGLAVGGILFVAGSFLGPAPSRRALVKFWGTREAIRSELTTEENPLVGGHATVSRQS